MKDGMSAITEHERPCKPCFECNILFSTHYIFISSLSIAAWVEKLFFCPPIYSLACIALIWYLLHRFIVSQVTSVVGYRLHVPTLRWDFTYYFCPLSRSYLVHVVLFSLGEYHSCLVTRFLPRRRKCDLRLSFLLQCLISWITEIAKQRQRVYPVSIIDMSSKKHCVNCRIHQFRFGQKCIHHRWSYRGMSGERIY